MAYLIFGLAIGTFISALIEKYHKTDKTQLIPASYLFILSGILFLVFLYVGWPLLKQAFT